MTDRGSAAPARPPGTPTMPLPEDETQILILGRYRREAILGTGGFGEVVRAFDTRFPRTVAIKTLRPDLSSLHRARFLEMETRFEREAEAASRMGVHRNIVTVHDRDRDMRGILYLIMEYLPGGTLRDRLRPAPGTIVALPRVEALQIGADVARGLHAAHVHRVVHRDVKPANIFLAAEGQAKIGDFGIAQMDEHTIVTGDSRGHPYTLLYASPEQMVVTSPLGPASDQYSLGLVLFEMLTGMAYKDLTEEERTDALRRHPVGVGALVGRMTADEARRRYGSLGEVVAAIEALGPEVRAWEAAQTEPAPRRVLPPTPPRRVPEKEDPQRTEPEEREPVLVPPGPPVKMDDDVPPRSTPRPVSRRAVLAGIGGIAVAGGVGIAILRRPDGSEPGTPTAPPTALPTVVSSVAATVAPTVLPTVTSTVAATPRIASPTAPAPPTVAVPAATLLRTLQGHTNVVRGVAFAPDGQTLASGSDDLTARLWRAADGALIRTITGFVNTVYGVAFAPDGQTLATTGSTTDTSNDPDTVQLRRVGDGMSLRTLSGFVRPVWSVAFAPDGQTLASGSDDRTARLWRVSDGMSLQTLLGHTDVVSSVAFSPDGKTLASASLDKTIRLWRVADGGFIRTLQGHTDAVYSVAFAPDGQTLASGSPDKTVRLWRASDGMPLQTLTGHDWVVHSVAFSPDGKTLASGSWDKTIRLWQLR